MRTLMRPARPSRRPVSAATGSWCPRRPTPKPSWRRFDKVRRWPRWWTSSSTRSIAPLGANMEDATVQAWRASLAGAPPSAWAASARCGVVPSQVGAEGEIPDLARRVPEPGQEHGCFGELLDTVYHHVHLTLPQGQPVALPRRAGGQVAVREP